MTFREMLIKKDLRVNHSDELGEVSVRNFDEMCPNAVEKYLRSAQFHRDLETCESEVLIALRAGWLSAMELWFRESSGKLFLSLEFAEDIDKL